MKNRKRMAVLATAALLLSGCGNQGTENQILEAEEKQESVNTGLADAAESPEDREKKEKFGENCLPEHSFETELNGLEGTVFLVSYASNEENRGVHINLIWNGEVMASINPRMSIKWFTSLEAVSLWDVNFDGFTDIIMIGMTNHGRPFAAVYYGEIYTYEETKRYHFTCMEELSENLSDQAKEPLTIKEIRRLLTGGKKNGEFESYEEAYEAVLQLSVLEGLAGFETEYGSKFLYDLIYVDEDEIPELVTGLNGYYVNLYTYEDGTVYMPMNQWGYGAMGNSGYEYAPGKNSMRNYNADQAGAIMNTYYMKINESHDIETLVWIESYNFVDGNGNDMLDEGEEYGEGPVYIDGEKASEEALAAVYDSYDVGDYQYIEGRMSVDEVRAALRQ